MEATDTPLRCKIRCKFYVPIPDVFDATNEKAILAALPATHPLKVALTGGGEVLLESKSGKVLLPVRKINLRSLQVLPASLCDEEEATHGLVIRLPDDLARLVHAWEACAEGVDYKWKPFFDFYLNDLGKESGRRLRRLLAARINGISGQVVTDVRCKRGEVMVSVKAAEKLLPTLKKQYPELEITDVQQMDGLRVVLQRFPVMGKKGCRWATLRVVKDRPSMLIYVNALDWNKLHRGDEDGDLGYIGIPRNSEEVKVVSVARVAAWPKLTFKNHEPLVYKLVADWVEKENPAKVETVVNFFTKDCIGPQTYMMSCLARAAAFEYARSVATAPKRRDALGRVTRAVFQANEPMAELVFDGRKTEGALGKFLGVVDAFQDAVAGKPFTAEPFHDFLETDEQRTLLANAIQMAGGSLRSCRSTAYGTIVASGRKIGGMVWDNKQKKMVARAGQIIDRLLTLGITPETMMDRLMDCALGVQFIEIPRQDNTWLKGQVEPVTEDMDAEPDEETGDEEGAPGQLLVPTKIRGIQEILLSVRDGETPAFSAIRIEKREEGDLKVEARLREIWRRGNQRTWKVELLLPNPAASSDVTPDGHKKVEMEGIEPRLFLPRFIWTGKNIEVQRFDSHLAHIVAEAVNKVADRMGRLEPEEVSEELNMQIRRLLNELPAFVDTELPVRMAEFEVIVATTGEMKQDWVNKEAALVVLAEHGFDVTTTSKNAPGTIVTKSWKRGIPRYLFAVNPLIPCLDLKRRPEGREVRLALPLFQPVKPTLVSVGSKLPPVMLKTRTELVCVIGDVPGYNLFVDDEDGEEFGHDTLLCTESANEKLAMARWEFSCASQEEVEDLEARLVDAGVGIDAIEVERNLNLLGEGLSIDTFRVHVEAKITDHGKVKACVGPFKGVMNPIPHRLFALNPDGTRTEIDVILPGTTVRKKKALDALLFMLAGKAGMTEIDPDFDPATLLAEIREGLRQTWVGNKTPNEKQLERLQNGMQPVMVVSPDGTEEVIGHAVVGTLPFYRPVQTGFSQFKLRTGEGGIKVQTHAMLMVGGIGYDVPQRLKEEFADIVDVRRKVKQSQYQEESLFDAHEDFEVPADV